MRFTKAVVVVHGHLLARFNGLDADECAVLFHLNIRRLRVIQINGHVHGVHAHDRDLNGFFIVIAKKFDLLLNAFR